MQGNRKEYVRKRSVNHLGEGRRINEGGHNHDTNSVEVKN